MSPKELFEQTYEINRRLADVALNGGGLRAIAQKLSDALGTPVIVEDAGWERLTARMPYRITPIINCESLKKQLTGFFLPYYRRAGYLTELAKGHRVIWEGLQEKGILARVIAPIFVDKELQGYISVLSLKGLPNELEVLACEQAAIVAALEISKERAVEQTRLRMEHDILHELVSHPTDSPELIQRHLSVLDWELDRAVNVISFELEGIEDEAFPEVAFAPRRLEELKQRIVRKIKTIVFQQDPKAVVVFLSDSDLTVIANPTEGGTPTREELQALVDAVRRVLVEAAPRLKDKVGIGGVSRQSTEVARSYEQARQALHVGMAMMSEKDMYHYDDLGLYKLLFELAGTKQLQDFYIENVGPLLDYDRANKSDFFHTLECYLESNGSVGQTADELFIHRNTLNYRLRRIEEILGQDLSDSETRLKMLLALRIRRITQAKESYSKHQVEG